MKTSFATGTAQSIHCPLICFRRGETANVYEPAPVDYSHIALGELERLVEPLAHNNHEVWARRRMAERWRWGCRSVVTVVYSPVISRSLWPAMLDDSIAPPAEI